MEEASKKELRSVFKEKRISLKKREEEELNTRLLLQFQQFVWEGLSYVHTFLPIRRFREPDTYRFVDWLREVYPEINLVISKSDLKNNLLDHFLWEQSQMLEVNRWGIEEPTGGQLIMPGQLDAVIVPLLAFDLKGNRIGYGKGFYDRFLAKCRPECLIVGVSFFEPVKKITDSDLTDVPLDFCITPERIWNFKE